VRFRSSSSSVLNSRDFFSRSNRRAKVSVEVADGYPCEPSPHRIEVSRLGLRGQLIESAAGARKRMINRSAKIVSRSDFDLFSPAQRPSHGCFPFISSIPM
jgi:hypothetical protein